MSKKACLSKNSGDDDSIQFVKMNYYIVFRYFLATCHDPDIAAELTQETFLKFLPKFYSLFREKRKPYMLRIAKNVWLSYLRNISKSSNKTLPYQSHISPDPVDIAAMNEAFKKLPSAIHKLTPLEQKVVYFHYYVGFRFKEIAEILGKPPGTIRSAHSRALKKLGGDFS